MLLRNQKPKGGTELQFEYLEKHVDKNLLDQVQICTSVPEKIPLHPTKPNILWQKNFYDQPNLAPGFKTLLIITSMTGMFLIHTGRMKSLETILKYQLTDAVLKMVLIK